MNLLQYILIYSRQYFFFGYPRVVKTTQIIKFYRASIVMWTYLVQIDRWNAYVNNKEKNFGNIFLFLFTFYPSSSIL